MEMNVERILALADIIEKQPHTKPEDEAGFTMENWTHDCGTPACICGWANYQRLAALGGSPSLSSYMLSAEYLGLDKEIAESIFEPRHPDAEESESRWASSEWWSEITPTHAAAVLRHLANTGEVDWAVSAPSVSPHE